MATASLVLRAGPAARRRLEQQGFQPDAFSTLVGASGGPKWLVLSQLDRILVRRLLAPRTRPLDLLGSSIGTFRHAAFAQRDPHAALARLEESYIEQSYREGRRPSPEEVSSETRRIHLAMLGEDGAREIVENPLLRSHVVTARLRGREADRGMAFRLGLGAAALANALSRRLLAGFFERVVFASPGGGLKMGGQSTPLTADNLGDAILASGSIPLVMAGVPRPPGAPRGTYFDGGIIDYHFDFEFTRATGGDGLVLFPHFFDRITPGWFDKPLRWRRPRASALDRVVLLAPSDAFVASLPGGKVPDRRDFEALRTAERQRRWREVVARCESLVSELEALLEDPSGRAQPFIV
ncbi:MAG: alpha/beta hydrolase [Deltaproteobacteria bacterium]|nr:alpha/beta hydrolase [Deltaproteobacteria bacterium]